MTDTPDPVEFIIWDVISGADERFDYIPALVAAALREKYDLAPRGTLARVAALEKVAEWLVSMDDPEDVLGREARRAVTLTQIIDRARATLDAVTDEGPGEPVEPDRPLEDYTTWRRYVAAPADEGRA